MLQFNSIADFEEALTRHEQELQSLRQLFDSYTEHVARLNNNSIAVHQENQRLRLELERLRSRVSTSEAAQATQPIYWIIGRRIFTVCTSVLNWFSIKVREIVRNFRQNPHLD